VNKKELLVEIGTDLLGVVEDLLAHNNFHLLDDGTKAAISIVKLPKIEIPEIAWIASIKSHLDSKNHKKL